MTALPLDAYNLPVYTASGITLIQGDLQGCKKMSKEKIEVYMPFKQMPSLTNESPYVLANLIMVVNIVNKVLISCRLVQTT